MENTNKGKFDIYAAVTDRIIAELEQGIIPWNKPWYGINCAVSHTNGREYSLLNQLLLGRGGEYITFKQAQKEGGSIKKGAKAKMVVFWKFLYKDKTDENGNVIKDENGNAKQDKIPVLKYYNVFHIDDCENIKPKYDVKPLDFGCTELEPIDRAEHVLHDYVSRENIKLIHGGNEAYYSPILDEIHLPNMERFMNIGEYYGTAFHEATHSTGHESRLNRLTKGKAAAFGGEDYSKEELVAEIGSAGILNILGIETESTFKNSAAYIQSWLNALKNDKRMIVSAAGRAEKAINLILNIKAQASEEQNTETGVAA